MNFKILNTPRRKMTLVLLILFTFASLPIIAPILYEQGYVGSSSLIYRIYAFLCHQKPWRSMHIHDHQFAWCTRDTLMYISTFISFVFYSTGRYRRIPWYVALGMLIPMGIDGGVQLIAEITSGNGGIPFYESTNLMRAITGILFGSGVGAWVASYICEEMIGVEVKSEQKSWVVPMVTNIAVSTILMLGLFNLWHSTSELYPPSARFYDAQQNIPGVNYEIVDLAGHSPIQRDSGYLIEQQLERFHKNR